MAKKKDELKTFWTKHIANKHLYRVVAERYVPTIRKHGFVPAENPFAGKRKDIRSFLSLLLRLYKKGFIMTRWWGRLVDQTVVVKTTRKDLQSNYIDFTPSSRIGYYKKLRGGALAQTVVIYTKELLSKKPKLSVKEWKLVRKLHRWSKKLCDSKNAVVVVKADSRFLEHAYFQRGGPYIESPFGRFEHFKKVVAKRGLRAYAPYLRGKNLFYLRTTKRVPASEIVRIS